MRFFMILSIFFLCLSQAEKAFAEPSLQAMEQSIRQLQQTMQSLQVTVESQHQIIQQQAVKIERLEQGLTVVGPAKTSRRGDPVGRPSPSGLNPDIGVAGTVQTKLTQSSEDAEGNDAIALKELELNFAHAVDPYSRLDAILTFNDNLEAQNVDIEEAYYTRWGLPFGFTTQLGKFRSKIGKQNLQHLHQLDTADYALVIRDFFGEEGLASSGIRLQNNVPNPWDIPVEVTGEVLRGNNGTSFSGISRRPIFNTHLKTYFDLSENSNLELGWTTLFGDENPNADPKGQGRYGVKVFGADATFNWHLPEGKKIKWQNEVYFQNRSSLAHVNGDPWGFYTLVDYKFSQKFSTGVRFDYLEPLDVAGGQHHQSLAIAPYITFWQSEFADFKLQYEHTEPAGSDARSDNMVFLQVDFLIGAHKHPVQ